MSLAIYSSPQIQSEIDLCGESEESVWVLTLSLADAEKVPDIGKSQGGGWRWFYFEIENRLSFFLISYLFHLGNSLCKKPEVPNYSTRKRLSVGVSNNRITMQLYKREEQTWYHVGSIPLALTFVFCCLGLVLLALHH